MYIREVTKFYNRPFSTTEPKYYLKRETMVPLTKGRLSREQGKDEGNLKRGGTV